MRKRIEAVQKRDFIFALLFLAGTGMIFYKCAFGYSFWDEPFYLTIPQRLFQGDSLFTQEWHLSQLASVLIYPFFALYRLFFTESEGILLHFRYLYTGLQALTALFIYVRLRKHGLFAAGASLMYLLFAPFGIMALSYNSIGVLCTTVSGVLLATNLNKQPATFFLIGLFYAGAVLCCPYLAAGYAIYAVVCIIRKDGKALLWVTLGCSFLAIIFIGFLLSRATLPDILRALPAILNDPEHPHTGFLKNLESYSTAIYRHSRFASPIIKAGAVLSGLILVDRHSPARRMAYGIAAIVLSILFTLPFVFSAVYLNFLLACPFFLGWFAFLLAPRENLNWFLSTWLLSLLYGLCVNWSSNQQFYVISMACMAGSIGSWIMVSNWLNLYSGASAGRWLKSCTLVIMALFIVAQAHIRFTTLFWEYGDMSQMSYEITVGPAKGLRTSAANKEFYETLYQDTQSVRDWADGPVLYYTRNTFLYLADSKDNASFSAWTSGINESSAKKLLEYYRLNPSKIPAIIYCLKADSFAAEHVSQFAKTYHYNLQETTLGYVLVSSNLT